MVDCCELLADSGWMNGDGPDVVGMLQLALKLSPVTALH